MLTLRTPQDARNQFDREGRSISGWARENGFSPAMVYAVLAGKKACKRGMAHRIAVLLGIKEGVIDGEGTTPSSGQ
ncbi:DNA-binding protein [Azonexus sp.]|uniref:DNA-binding protein n=1 Tax=Azonexus sp. TaxID=1872668 RepID=UPI00359FFD13